MNENPRNLLKYFHVTAEKFTKNFGHDQILVASSSSARTFPCTMTAIC